MSKQINAVNEYKSSINTSKLTMLASDLTCCKAPPPLLACSVWTMNSDALCLLWESWPEPLQVWQAPCITHHLIGCKTVMQAIPWKQDCSEGVLPGTTALARLVPIPRLVAMLLWLLIDRRILDPCADEYSPSESYWPGTAPYMDQD